MARDVEVQGLEELLKAIDKLEPKIKLKIIKNSTKAGAMLIKNKAKANANVFTKSGALVRGLAVKQMKVNPDIIGSIVTVREKKQRTKSQKKRNEDPFYWRFIEYGFYKKAGTFFIKKAYDSLKNRVAQEMERKVASDIEKFNGS